MRIEITLSKEQNEKLQKAKEAASHVLINSNTADLIEYLANFFLEKKQGRSKRTSESEVPSENPRCISLALRRKIFQRDESCRWKNSVSQKLCCSKHQLEIDHIKPVWAGGEAKEENLQLLCRAHNSFVYRTQNQTKLV